MNAKQRQAAENADRAELLRNWLEPTHKVYVQLGTVARSGMSRTLKLFIAGTEPDGPRLINITYHAAPLIGEKVNGDGFMRVTGGGMDMGFQTVYNLSYALYGKGVETGNHKSDGPYALKHEWM